jgi:hypothetical protein
MLSKPHEITRLLSWANAGKQLAEAEWTVALSYMSFERYVKYSKHR